MIRPYLTPACSVHVLMFFYSMLRKFSSDGTVVDIPYLRNKEKCSVQKKLQTYEVVYYCGLVMVYYHADYKPPEFQPPQYLPNLFKNEKWALFKKWDLGYHTHNVIEWVDQAGDHSHFNTLHSNFVIPWTTFEIPRFIHYFFPIGIDHVLETYRGDDQAWIDRFNKTNEYAVDKCLLFFTDRASLTWNGEIIKASASETVEMFLGPSNIIMNIPFTIGKLTLSIRHHQYMCLNQ